MPLFSACDIVQCCVSFACVRVCMCMFARRGCAASLQWQSTLQQRNLPAYIRFLAQQGNVYQANYRRGSGPCQQQHSAQGCRQGYEQCPYLHDPPEALDIGHALAVRARVRLEGRGTSASGVYVLRICSALRRFEFGSHESSVLLSDVKD
jgi:hypothetical protein